MARRSGQMSFGLRIALYSFLLSMVALVAFAVAAWWMIRDAQLHALDSTLAVQLQREILHPRNTQDWQQYESQLAAALGGGNVLLAVEDKRAADKYFSATWPENIPLDSLSWPTPPADDVTATDDAGKTDNLDAAEVAVPEVVVPEVAVPEVAVPEVAVPDTGVPDVTIPALPEPDDNAPPSEPPPRFGLRRDDSQFRIRQQERQLQRQKDLQKIHSMKQALVDEQQSLLASQKALEESRKALLHSAEQIKAQALEDRLLARKQQVAGMLAARISPVKLQDIQNNGQHYRVAVIERPGMRMAAGVNLDVVAQQMQPVQRAFFMAIALASLFVAAAAWWLSHRALLPVRELTTAVRRLGAARLDQRVDDDVGDLEFSELAQGFNQMLERLERSFTQAARFSGDAAHELKTPLAILQAQVERALDEAEEGSAAQAQFAGLLDEIQHLGTVVRKLLLLSLADAGRLRLNTSKIDLTAELEELVDDARMLAPQLTINASIAEGLVVEADRDLLQQVLHNLLGNAIKYNIEQGWITITARYKDRHVYISLLNATSGLTAEVRKRLFERFYRGDAAHSGRADSAGLGLSLSREIARAHGGDLLLENSDPGIAQFSLRLPRVQLK